MRNWNNIWQATALIPQSRLYFTYEELKLEYYEIPIFRGRVVCILPMRNWNEVRLLKLRDEDEVCILPMRNWNLAAKLVRRKLRNCLYFTYEELKRGNFEPGGGTGREFVFYLWGIETRHGCRLDKQPGKRLYFTYEELKPPKGTQVVDGENVCILPMRNWNMFTDPAGNAISPVCILPMRNWNLSALPLSR